jgi:branched-chain amino acid transport system permease protein
VIDRRPARSHRPLSTYDCEPLLGLFMTFGIALFLEELIRTVWGAGGRPFDPPAMLSGFIIWGPVLVTKYRLFVLALTAAILFALWLFLQRTRYGRIIRAGSRDACCCLTSRSPGSAMPIASASAP